MRFSPTSGSHGLWTEPRGTAPTRRSLVDVVPTELLVTAMIGGFAVALTAVLAMAGLLSSRIGDVRADVRDLRGEFGELRGEFGGLRGEFGGLRHEFGAVRDEMVTVRAALGAVEQRLTTLERR